MTKAELDQDIEYKKQELRWVRYNPNYVRSIGLNPFRKEMELWQELGMLLYLRRQRYWEHRLEDGDDRDEQ